MAEFINGERALYKSVCRFVTCLAVSLQCKDEYFGVLEESTTRGCSTCNWKASSRYEEKIMNVASLRDV